MNELKYLYEFNGTLEIEYNDRFLKITRSRIVTDLNAVYLNNELYLGGPLKPFEEIRFDNIRIIYHPKYLISSIVLPLNELKIEYEEIKERKVFQRKYQHKEIKPDLLIELKKVNLDRVNNNTSVISFLPMVMMSLASLSTVILNVYQKTNTFVIKDNIQQLLLPLVMLFSTLILQPFIRFSERNRIVRNNNRKIKEYEKYLDKQKDNIKEFKRQNENYLNNIYLDEDILNQMIINEDIYRYQKEDDGYLVLSLGKGTVYFENLKIRNNNNEDNRISELSKQFLTNNTKANIGPILLDLKKENYPCFVLDKDDFTYADFILLSLFITVHPKDLKTCVLVEEEYLKHFSYLYDIKHLTYDSLCHVFTSDERQYKDADLLIVIGKCFIPKTDDSKTVISIVTDISDVPASTKELIIIKNDSGTIKRNDSVSEFHFKKNKILTDEFIKLIHQYEYQKELSPSSIIPLTDLYPFDPAPNSLKAVLGRNNQGKVVVDLDETKDGPHGLVVGMTGSGKSELLLTLVLSLSLNYSPYYINFVIVDFKGGGIVNILNNRERKLKHLVSSLTNIDSINFERILVSFRNECLKRQLLFKKAGDISGENITNIKDYLTLVKRGIIKEHLPHLVIILDEFAEIKKEHSEVIDELLSISRIGRSLGIHLILCTQRAQGIIDDEIRSNAGFKICLKVNSKEDSREVIESEDAASIKEKGGFYLLTDNYYIYGKSAYTNADIYKSYLKKTELLNDNLETIEKIYSRNNSKALTEAAKIIDVINKRYERINLDEQKLWLDPLKEAYRTESSVNKIAFGTIDDYRNKKQYPAEISYLKNNLVISIDKKKKEQHLINCLNDLIEKDIDVYLINLSRYSINNQNIISINEKNEYEISYLINVLNHLKESFRKESLIIITDLKSFLSIDDSVADILKKALEQSDNYNYKFLIYTAASTDYSYSFSLLFDHLVYIGDFKSDEVLNLFSKSYRNESVNDGLIDYEEIKEFKLFSESLKTNNKTVNSIIRYIPLKRYLKKEGSKFTLGYSVEFAEEFILDVLRYTRIIVFTYDEALLIKLKEIFKEYDHIICSNAEESRNYKKEFRSSPILFFGSGITSNYDLNYGIREDTDDDEMLFIYKSEKVRIKYFNEWS